MIWSHWNLPVCPARSLAPVFFCQNGCDHGDHIGMAFQVSRFMERPAKMRFFECDIAQMQEMHPFAQTFHHAR
ncbi:hypothetical protein FQZ97_1107680 [compost metagenome]